MAQGEPTDAELDAIADGLAPYHRRILLTGAGFSKLWGGYLASELWSVIVSDPALRGKTETDRILHEDLNFEETLARVQDVDRLTVEQEGGTQALWDAVIRAFEIMDRRIERENVGQQRSGTISSIVQLLSGAEGETGCFFTLNQDLLVERTLSLPAPNPTLPTVLVPGVPAGLTTTRENPGFDPVTLLGLKGRLSYIKLHGSMNWREAGTDVVVLGGAKPKAINRFPILRLNTAIFRRALRQKGARLVVIGYGFGDEHINEAIRAAVADRTGLAIWIVDPREPRLIKDTIVKKLVGGIWPSVVGHSTSALDLFSRGKTDYQLLHDRFWTAA